VVAAYGAGKGFPAGRLFLCGLFVSPFLVLLGVTLVTGREPRRVVRTEEQRCPDCAEVVLAQAHVCRYCGYRFGSRPPLDSREVRALDDLRDAVGRESNVEGVPGPGA
jgi:hypothetical protein